MERAHRGPSVYERFYRRETVHEVLWSVSIHGLWSMVNGEGPKGTGGKVSGRKGPCEPNGEGPEGPSGKISGPKGPFTTN